MHFEKLNVFLHGYDAVEIPEMVRVRQKFDAQKLDDPEAEIRTKLKAAMAADGIEVR